MKLHRLKKELDFDKSLPSWERGLKFGKMSKSGLRTEVAPLVGAWVEILESEPDNQYDPVAPLVGAWVEIRKPTVIISFFAVAPLVGACVEKLLYKNIIKK